MGRGLKFVLFNDFPRQRLAAATLAGNAQRLADLTEIAITVLKCAVNIAICDTVANTDVHGKAPTKLFKLEVMIMRMIVSSKPVKMKLLLI